ncbi:hypothetical protein evm_009310 [Chilo suppressalis]|nr:hypothetical protein evm_009310 [Chilo suppressalis]
MQLTMVPFLAAILFAATTIASDPKSVNVQLEASIQLDPGDFFRNTNILRTANNFFETIKSTFEQRATNDDEEDVDKNDKPPEARVLSKFLLDLGTELLHYKEDTLKELAEILHKEANEYYRRGPYSPDAFNEKVRKFVMKKLKDLSDYEPSALKIITRRFAASPNEITSLAVVGKLDKYFGENDIKSLDNIIKRLHFDAKTGDRAKITQTIKDALQFLIVDRYKLMKDNEKERFRNEVEKIVDGEPAGGASILNILRKIVDDSFKNYFESLFTKTADTAEKSKQKEAEKKFKVGFKVLTRRDLDNDNDMKNEIDDIKVPTTLSESHE